MKAQHILTLIQMSIAADQYDREGDVMRRDALDFLIKQMVEDEEANEDR